MSPSTQLKTQPQTLPSQLSLNDWASRCINDPSINRRWRIQVQCWLRGNAIDILCEGDVCPEVSITIDLLTEGLKKTQLQTLLPPGSPQILMVCVHGRTRGNKRPNWTVRLDPHQPDTVAPPEHLSTRHLSARNTPAVHRPKISDILPPMPPSQDWMAARQGNESAIASYLSQTLKSWGLGVKVIVKIQTLEKSTPDTGDLPADGTPELNRANPWSANNLNGRIAGSFVSTESNSQPATSQEPQKRLWVVCQSAYSPEPLSIAPPLGTHLRQLDLQGFKDAVILGQVSGEKQPEWILRVDLTPAKQILENWARWGDVQAITQLLHQRLIEALPGSLAEDLQVSGVLKESTLHVFFSDPEFAVESEDFRPESNTLSKEAVKAAIAPVLEKISPQNIFGITIYGLKGDRAEAQLPTGDRAEAQLRTMEAAPLWVDWLDLPASRHASLAPTTMELASGGDLAAVTFLLDRLLNPDLEEKLNTGGIRVSIRHKTDLLHIMVDAATCPPRRVGGKVAKFIASLNMPQIGGVRVYGRRSGQKQSSWRYGLDFQSRESIAGDSTPEFTVAEPSNSSSPDLLPQPGNLVIRPDVNSEDLQACLTTQPSTKLRKKKSESPSWLQQGLMVSGLFIPVSSAAPNHNLTGVKVTLIWGLLGLLFTLQGDWFLAELVQLRQHKLGQTTSNRLAPQYEAPGAIALMRNYEPDADLAATNSSRADDDDSVFDGSGFTAPLRSQNQSFNGIANQFKYPSFNSQQMDEQLAMYAQYVANYGVPDVLIVGSSRALRGIDPAVLRRELGNRYPDLRIFNFGVNGATAQVVHLIVRELLGQQQLPQLIVWADGARAFNSGRSDRTFEGITTSPGYRELQLGLRPPIDAPESEEAENGLASLTVTLAQQARKGFSVKDAYQQLDKWFNDRLGSFSASYPQRDDLNDWFSDSLRSSISERSQSLLSDPNNCLSILPSCQRREPTENPNRNLSAEITTEDLQSTTHRNGFLPIKLQFDPAIYYEQYALVSGDYDADYDSFNLSGEQTAATINLLSFLQRHQVYLVFVNMPLTADYLDSTRLKHEKTFQKYMLRLALEYGFIFRDFSQEWPTEHNYFSDPSHLNYLGAQRVSDRLAQDPLIPWPTSQSPD